MAQVDDGFLDATLEGLGLASFKDGVERAKTDPLFVRNALTQAAEEIREILGLSPTDVENEVVRRLARISMIATFVAICEAGR